MILSEEQFASKTPRTQVNDALSLRLTADRLAVSQERAPVRWTRRDHVPLMQREKCNQASIDFVCLMALQEGASGPAEMRSRIREDKWRVT